MKLMMGFFVTLLLIGCTIHQEGVIQKADLSYIMFKGNVKEVTVKIDNNNPFQIEGAENRTLYQLRPGKHIIKVFRNGELIVNRILFLDNQTTTEVLVP